MDLRRILPLVINPARMFDALGQTSDPWQRELLLAPDRQLLLNCSRQAGKSTTAAVLALHTVLFRRNSLVLLVSPTLRQSQELYRKVLDVYHALGGPLRTVAESCGRLELANGSRVLALPGREGTIRGFSKVALLIIDEASRVPDELYHAVRPMLAVSQGRLVVLSTPFGCRGFFYREWTGDGPWKRVRVTWRDCPRITPEFIAEERRAFGESWVRQEYEGEFMAMTGLVFPDFAKCVADPWPNPTGKPVGGIDFGWRNPFAAVWGVHDRDDVLWIAGEYYRSRSLMHEYAAVLKQQKSVMWYADCAGSREINELRVAGLAIRAGDSSPGAIRFGIAAVASRIATGRLKVHPSACPNLLQEAQRYHYGEAGDGENPVDADNHALAALRYLVSRIDERYVARMRRRKEDDETFAPRPSPDPDLNDERIWQ